MEGLAQIDKQITLAINSIHTPFMDGVWTFFSDKEVWFPLYAAVAVMLFVRMGWKKGAVALIGIILTIVACDQTGNLFKYSFERLRPCHDGWMLENGLRVLEDRWGLYGFFSAHAANAFGFAVSSSMAFDGRNGKARRAYGIVVIVWASLVGASRIFVGKHFFGDVLVGAAFGILFGMLAGQLIRFIYRYTGPARP